MKDLRHFLDAVRQAGSRYYVEAKKEVDSDLGPCAIMQQLSRQGRNPVVMLPHVKRSNLPIVTGLLAGYELLGLALDVPPEQIATEGRQAVQQAYASRIERHKPQRTVSAFESPVRQLVLSVDSVDLGVLPIVRHAPKNPAPYLTAGVLVCVDPDTGVVNAGIYRTMVAGRDTLHVMMVESHDAARVARRYAELGQKMPVSVNIGHHPAVILGATHASPREESELNVIGGLLGQQLDTTVGLTVPVPALARGEICLEGWIDPEKQVSEGPFSEAGGYYGEGRPAYALTVSAITMRRDAIYHDIAPTHQEHMNAFLLGRECRLLAELRPRFPALRALHIGPDTKVGKSLLYLSTAAGTFEHHLPLARAAFDVDKLLRYVVVVDEDVDVFDEGEVLWAISTRMRADGRLHILEKMPSLPAHPLAYDETGTRRGNLDTKVVMDATLRDGWAFPEKVTYPSIEGINLRELFG